jgi:hypothetical protein
VFLRILAIFAGQVVDFTLKSAKVCDTLVKPSVDGLLIKFLG